MISNLDNAILDIILQLLNPSCALLLHTADDSIINLAQRSIACEWHKNIKISISAGTSKIVALCFLPKIDTLSGGSISVTESQSHI